MPLTSAGYVYERLPLHPLADKRGRVLQHRRVWFDAKGSIPDGYVIHHINGKKTDNRIENLELCDRSSHIVVCLDAGTAPVAALLRMQASEPDGMGAVAHQRGWRCSISNDG